MSKKKKLVTVVGHFETVRFTRYDDWLVVTGKFIAETDAGPQRMKVRIEGDAAEAILSGQKQNLFALRKGHKSEDDRVSFEAARLIA